MGWLTHEYDFLLVPRMVLLLGDCREGRQTLALNNYNFDKIYKTLKSVRTVSSTGGLRRSILLPNTLKSNRVVTKVAPCTAEK